MNEHTLRVLEFDKVRSIVAGFAATEAGKARTALLEPASEEPIVAGLLEETRECTRILQAGRTPSFDGVAPLGPVLEKLAAAGMMLTPQELFQAASTLRAARNLKRFFEKLSESGAGIGAPLLLRKAKAIRPLRDIEDAIGAAIDESAEVRDSASTDLRRIRRQLARTRDDVLARLSRILQDSGTQKVIQEPVITLRDDRFVLPLKPNFRQSLRGVVHGQSGSRATLFVEPLDILEQNNRLAELRMEEREETERILRELTSFLTAERESVTTTVEALAELDAVHARARFGIRYSASVPVVFSDKGLQLRSARHPLLVHKYGARDGAEVAPNDIVLTGRERAMVLSGPNAGGKTVVLKTAGLLCLMAQSGLPITASEGSQIFCFGSVFADIGDEQSIEQDLSTFSSHMAQIASILRDAREDSLVLLDELGSGTEPGEGAALGAAVLESLIGRGCVSLVTTHHNALKLFGSQTAGAVNAAMEYDVQTLKPSYRLMPGRPGRSYGLDMASRLGLPDEVIDRARVRVGPDHARLEALLEQIEQDTRLLSEERRILEQELNAARRERSDAEASARTAREEARETAAKARRESAEVVSALKQRLRELSRASVLGQAEAVKARTEIETLGRKLETPEPEDAGSSAAAGVHPGDAVRIVTLNKTGTVLESSRDSAEIEIDGKRVRVPLRAVVPVPGARVSGKGSPLPGWNAELGDEEAATDRLNIIGMRVEEGLAAVDRFVDRAEIHHFSRITIIHGLGTGVLKTAVGDFLRKHALVVSVRPGEAAEGGAGVTIAELKK